MPPLRDILEAATPGPWTHYDGPYDDWDRVVLDHFTSEGPYVWEASHDKPTVLADARLIALAPELAALVLDMGEFIRNVCDTTNEWESSLLARLDQLGKEPSDG